MRDEHPSLVRAVTKQLSCESLLAIEHLRLDERLLDTSGSSTYSAVGDVRQLGIGDGGQESNGSEGLHFD